MRVEAYICDYCSCMFSEDNVLELRTEPIGIFGSEEKFMAINPVRKKHFSNVHFCLLCFNANVTDLCKNIDRKKDEKEYIYHYNLYRNRFYQNVYNKALVRNTARNR